MADDYSGYIQAGGAAFEGIMGAIGRAQAEGDYAKADAMYQQMLSQIDASEVPKFQRMAAEMLPEPERIQGGGEGRSAQSMALQKLSSFVDQNGLDAQARSANEEALGLSDQRQQANRGAIQQAFARKGMSGSGSELASLLQAQQGDANQARRSSLDIAGQARQRALAALGQQAQIGGQMRGQDIDVEGRNAAAANAREQFNAKMKYAAQGDNNDLLQSGFNNNMSKIKAKSEALGVNAKNKTARGQQTQSDFSGIGKAGNYAAQGFTDDDGKKKK